MHARNVQSVKIGHQVEFINHSTQLDLFNIMSSATKSYIYFKTVTIYSQCPFYEILSFMLTVHNGSILYTAINYRDVWCLCLYDILYEIV